MLWKALAPFSQPDRPTWQRKAERYRRASGPLRRLATVAVAAQERGRCAGAVKQGPDASGSAGTRQALERGTALIRPTAREAKSSEGLLASPQGSSIGP